MHEERLTNLESTVAHLEHKMEELSSLAFDQGKIIEALRAKLGMMQAKIEDMEERSKEGESDGLSPSEFAAQNKPPHY